MKKLKFGFCPRCFSLGKLVRHHCLPLRFFGKNNLLIFLCEDCHQEIEKILPLKIKLTPEQYLRITVQFIHWQEIELPKGENYGQLRLIKFRGDQPSAV